MDTRSSRGIGIVGTIAAVVGACWLVLLADRGFPEWRFVAAVTLVSGLLLRIEAAVRERGRL
ncbi:hypothetical protein COO58_20540 [Micromonospora sp. WMMA1996]|uniref:hypothetical protein n=1 Tax=Micromonospora TaxID=1873 RepID=UPI000AF5BB76|nr:MULTISPECIES: hypothetical protein [Micromonospora]PGH42132.1 hypothetical protein COO58_20540 [Micromonospora sp. WMMA1996]